MCKCGCVFVCEKGNSPTQASVPLMLDRMTSLVRVDRNGMQQFPKVYIAPSQTQLDANLSIVRSPLV